MSHDTPIILVVVAAGCVGWYIFILGVCTIGTFHLYRQYGRSPTLSAVSSTLPLARVPHVTVIRPVKGIEPYLYECLAATFEQNYPVEKLTTFFCISSTRDPAYSILERLLHDYPLFDAKILVEEEDPNLASINGQASHIGPNPKIRNMSRGYREAKGDIIWIIDCNVWIEKKVAGRMVDGLCGFASGNKGRKYKFVHQLPLAVDISDSPAAVKGKLPVSEPQAPRTSGSGLLERAGGLLEELFLSTSHAKFYTAISTVAVAPCVVGKSNMFRRSHLDALTSARSEYSPGIDFFSQNICEDHLIGDLLWKSPIPNEIRLSALHEGQDETWNPAMGNNRISWGNHYLLPSAIALQPMSYLPLSSYVARRTRWLRVRKFTVPLATLVESGIESLLCSAYGALGLTTLPWCNAKFAMPQTWGTFAMLWFMSVLGWMLVDYWVWAMLQGAIDSAYGDEGLDRPAFARKQRRSFTEWACAWLTREILAFPIWVWAVMGGTTVIWRGRRFWVDSGMKVHEMKESGNKARIC